MIFQRFYNKFNTYYQMNVMNNFFYFYSCYMHEKL